MNERDECKLHTLEDDRDFSENFEFDERADDSDENDVPRLRDPTRDLSVHRDCVRPVAIVKNGRLNHLDGHLVVVVRNVEEEDDDEYDDEYEFVSE